MNIEIPIFRQVKDQFTCPKCEKGTVVSCGLGVCEECWFKAMIAFREAFDWPIEGIQWPIDWDRCSVKGHKWGDWTDASQGNETWQERHCGICTLRETRNHRRGNK